MKVTAAEREAIRVDPSRTISASCLPVLITPEYKELNRQLHKDNPDYGVSGHRWGKVVLDACRKHQCRTVLDYGCGKRTLWESLGKPIWLKEFDPCIEGLDTPPEPAELVMCGDVLEHIEPECLDDVLADVARLTQKIAVFVVATRLAGKNLPDGRNTHLIVESQEWWVEKLGEYFVPELQDLPAGKYPHLEFVYKGKPKDE